MPRSQANETLRRRASQRLA